MFAGAALVCSGAGSVVAGGLSPAPCTPGARWHREAEMVPWHAGRGGSKVVAKCFENLPAFLRKDFRNLLPRFARGGTTIARHCDFLSPLDPFLGSLAYRRVSLVTARFLCGFMPLYPWHASRGKVSMLGLSQTSIVLPLVWSFADNHCVTLSLVFRRHALCYPRFGFSQTSLVLPSTITACVPWWLFCCHCGMSIRSIRSILPSVS